MIFERARTSGDQSARAEATWTRTASSVGDDDASGAPHAREAARAIDLAMSLSGADAKRLAAALACLLSPDALTEAEAWQRAAAEALRDLVSADAVCIAHESPGRAFTACGLDGGTLTDYEQRYALVDFGIARQRARHLRYWTRRMLWSHDELKRSEYYNEFARPHGLMDGAGVAAYDAPHSIRVSLLYAHAAREGRHLSASERHMHLLRLAQPAFETGATMTLRCRSYQGTLAQIVDRVGRPLALCTAAGRIVHQNPDLASAIAIDPEELPRAIATVARAVTTSVDPRQLSASTVRDVSRTCGRWRVVGTRLEWDLGGPAPTILISLMAGRSDVATPERVRTHCDLLRNAYGLTCREMEVLYLLRERRSNLEIARALRISEHTARHHTENVLLKLGVHSRCEVERMCERAVRPPADAPGRSCLGTAGTTRGVARVADDLARRRRGPSEEPCDSNCG